MKKQFLLRKTLCLFFSVLMVFPIISCSLSSNNVNAAWFWFWDKKPKKIAVSKNDDTSAAISKTNIDASDSGKTTGKTKKSKKDISTIVSPTNSDTLSLGQTADKTLTSEKDNISTVVKQTSADALDLSQTADKTPASEKADISTVVTQTNVDVLDLGQTTDKTETSKKQDIPTTVKYTNDVYASNQNQAVKEAELVAPDKFTALLDYFPGEDQELAAAAFKIITGSEVKPHSDALKVHAVNKDDIEKIKNAKSIKICGKEKLDLTGIEHFSNLKTLQLICCGRFYLEDDFTGKKINNALTIRKLPESLIELKCSNCGIATFPASLPKKLKTFYCDGCNFSKDGNIFSAKILAEGENPIITDFSVNQCGPYTLPDSIEVLNSSGSNFEPSNLPKNLKTLKCSNCSLKSLPDFPKNLVYCDCSYNEIENLSKLPKELTYLNCQSNKLKFLPKLVDSITELNCSENEITNLPNLPNSLQILSCSSTNITSFPKAPDTLKKVNCYCCGFKSRPNGFSADVTVKWTTAE